MTRTFKWSLGLTLLGAVLFQLARGAVGLALVVTGAVLLVTAGPVFLVSLTRLLLRKAQARVGYRLFGFYLLVGVVPVPLLMLLTFVFFYVLSGQLAARRMEGALAARLATLGEIAAELADAPPEQRDDVFARRTAATDLGGAVGYAFRPPGGPSAGRGPYEPERLLPAARDDGPLDAVATLADGRHFLAARRAGARGAVLVYQPIEPDLRIWIESTAWLAVDFPQARAGFVSNQLTVHYEDGRMTASFGGSEAPLELFALTSVASPGRPAVFWARTVELPYVVWEGEDPATEPRWLISVLRTSIQREVGELFGAASGAEQNLGNARFAVRALKAVAGVTLVIYVLASVLATLLVLRIARATHRLEIGLGEVERGNFDHRARLRGSDQLASLVAGFNRMAASLGEAVEQRARGEALEHELRLARDLQRRLLPPPDFAFPGLDVAVDFRPATAIGGDFYHFAAAGAERLVVVIADVSGHGLATGIVMSAAKALFSALAAREDDARVLLAELDAELAGATDRRTFVTLAHCAFDLAARQVAVTSAGHLPPYRVAADGRVTAIVNDSRPLGLSLPAEFRTVTAPLAGGDLWVLISDGIVEALSPAGEAFGFARLEEVLAAVAGRDAGAARDAILEAWRRFTGHDEPEDDRTLIVLGVAGPPHGEAG